MLYGILSIWNCIIFLQQIVNILTEHLKNSPKYSYFKNGQGSKFFFADPVPFSPCKGEVGVQQIYIREAALNTEKAFFAGQ